MDGEECPNCGRTGRTVEGGTEFCAACGQQLGPVAAVEGDEQDYQARGKVIRIKDQRVKQKASKIYRGVKGYKLFLQAWQHILWRQCHAAVHVCGLPPELWDVVKDLWALRLAKLAHRLEAMDNRADAATSDGEQLSTGSEGLTETTMSISGDEAGPRDVTASCRASQNPKLIDTIVLLYVGTLLLRYPLRLATLFDWIKTETVPYIRPIRYVPNDIRNHLASEYDRALDTISIPKPQDLQLAMLRTATMYSRTFGMSLAAINSVPLLLACANHLALPLQVYPMAMQLNKILGFDFAYPTTSTTRRQATTYPEAQLMSLLVMATKILFPFDATIVKRYPKSLNEPGALCLDWTKWAEAKDRFDVAASLLGDKAMQPGTEIFINDVAVMNMADDELDHYMDWYQSTFARVKEREENNLGKQVLEMFTVADVVEPSLEDKAKCQKQKRASLDALRAQRQREVLGSLATRRVISEEDEARTLEDFGNTPSRMGDGYQSFRDVNALSGPSKAFYEEAASVACLTLEQLIRAVNHAEQKVEKWRRAQRRNELWPDEMEVEAGEEEAEDLNDPANFAVPST